MPPYEDSLDPVALPGEAVRTVPDGRVYEVLAVEQMAKVGPTDYGAASAGQDATENNSNTIDLTDELGMDSGTIGQFWLNPLSMVEVEIRQNGQQEQRFVNSNQSGAITPNTPRPQRQVFVVGDEDIYGIITNRQSWDMSKTLVYYTGYKLVVDETSEARVDNMRGQPATIPTDSLKQNTVQRPNSGGRR